MSIMLYSGTPGSYKSFHAVKQCIRWLKSGGNLITNFPLNYKRKLKKPIKGVYECVNNLDLTVDYLIKFACEYHTVGVKAQTLVVIDEASIKFNSRDFNMHDRMDWINFFANHRHFNFNVILITQQDKMLDKQIRGLIEIEFKHRALKNYKLFGLILDLIFKGCFMCVEVWYPCRLKTGAVFSVFRKSYAECYDTMGLFVDTKSKMAEARRKIQDSQEVKTIVQVDDEDSKKQVHEDMSEFVTVLSSYVQCNNKTTDSTCNSGNRRCTVSCNSFGRFISWIFNRNRKQQSSGSLPGNI